MTEEERKIVIKKLEQMYDKAKKEDDLWTIIIIGKLLLDLKTTKAPQSPAISATIK